MQAIWNTTYFALAKAWAAKTTCSKAVESRFGIECMSGHFCLGSGRGRLYVQTVFAFVRSGAPQRKDKMTTYGM